MGKVLHQPQNTKMLFFVYGSHTHNVSITCSTILRFLPQVLAMHSVKNQKEKRFRRFGQTQGHSDLGRSPDANKPCDKIWKWPFLTLGGDDRVCTEKHCAWSLSLGEDHPWPIHIGLGCRMYALGYEWKECLLLVWGWLSTPSAHRLTIVL